MTTGGTGLPGGVPDTRIPNVNNLPPGPFQLTSDTLPYDAYAASPVHRFYQMWQQFDCNASYSTRRNPSGCLADLFPWVEVTIGAGSNGSPQPSDFNLLSTREGGTAMGFYNVLQGDVPYLKLLADNYAMSDNFHQSVMGGTGANHVMLGTGDTIWFSEATDILPYRLTTNWWQRILRTQASSMRLRIRTRSRARTIITRKMATEKVRSAHSRPVAELTATVLTLMNRASPQYSLT